MLKINAFTSYCNCTLSQYFVPNNLWDSLASEMTTVWHILLLIGLLNFCSCPPQPFCDCVICCELHVIVNVTICTCRFERRLLAYGWDTPLNMSFPRSQFHAMMHEWLHECTSSLATSHADCSELGIGSCSSTHLQT